VTGPAVIGRYRPPDFTGAVAVVTGGGQGIGAAVAKGLAACGARVVIDGRRPASLKQTADGIAAAGGECEWVEGSVTDPDHVAELMSRAAGGDRIIHALVNNAGIAGPTKPVAELSLDEWNETIAVNLTGVFLACRAAIPYLRAGPHGKIVNIGSATGKRPLPDRAGYAAAKLGVVGLTRTLAHELGKDNISVNTISPFLVENARLSTVISAMAMTTGRSPDEVRAELMAGTAFGRPVTEDDVTRLTLMLCSSAADDLTGQDINVTSGAVMY
jgi:NAD(P)-dependent dehydrogenase (short-subunit alcohol dehydrogenase family)